jgi:hypothetical protein
MSLSASHLIETVSSGWGNGVSQLTNALLDSFSLVEMKANLVG